MSDPTFEYESRSNAAHRARGGVGAGLAVLSLLAGAVLASLFVVGFGLGDAWVIYPPTVPPHWWVLPASLIGWPVWYLARRAGK
ncbi:MAG: hypothetical protein JWO31_3449 [Phycisphaerales bacterium]|nr:hypothetical protein [Phycisphaerales bacterium]